MIRRPAQLPPSAWQFSPDDYPDDDCIGLGADLDASTLVEAYRHGAFPMPHGEDLLWFSPLRRGVLPMGFVRRTRSLRQSARHLTTTVDEAFDDVVAGCADPSRPGGWIDDAIREAYGRLHALGWAHSIETRDADGRLVGGLYGVMIGDLFCGESMFHRERDASKVALLGLVDRLGEGALVDVQWQTPHLASLGVVEWSRERYLAALDDLTSGPSRSL